MKLKKNIYLFAAKFDRLKSVNLLLFGILLLVSACTEDRSQFNTGIDGETSITLILPDLDNGDFNATRDRTASVESQEGKYNSLWLFAFPQNGKGSKLVVKLSDLNSTLTDKEYKKYKVSIAPGQYKFFLFANPENYLTQDNKSLFSLRSEATEEELNNLVLDFSKNLPELGKLPMVALPTDISEHQNGVVTVEAHNTEIHADLKFLCSKIRFTILFDNTPGGISDVFDNHIIEFITNQDPSLYPIIREIAVNSSDIKDTPLEKLFTFKLGKYQYPENENYPANASDALTPWDESTDWGSARKKAWQVTFYVPENLAKESKLESKFSFPYTISEISDILEPKTFTLKEIERSRMYDICMQVSTLNGFEDWHPQLEVFDWNPQTLSYQLRGPFELIVEKSNIDIQSGYWSSIFYTTDADKVTIDSPTIKIDGKDVPFYKYELVSSNRTDVTDDDGNPYEFGEWPNLVRISVNDAIPYSVMRTLNTGGETEDGKTLSNLKYFHIVAANLHKKILINNLKVGAYLTVTPLKIEIDARQYYTSGIHSEVFDPNGKYTEEELKQFLKINFKTNFDSSDETENLSLTLSDPNGLLKGKGRFEDSEENNNFAFIVKHYFEEGKISEIPNNNNNYNISIQEGDFYLDLRGLLGESNYWQSKHEYTLTFTLTLPDDEDGKRDPIERTVKITVKPFTTNYTIHFYDNTKEWDTPHIYVYQILTLPSDMKNTENEKYKWAGKMVGYMEDDGGNEQINSAVQYLFTNGVSFKGWDGYGGPDINDPFEKGLCDASTMGFVMFGNKEGNYFNFKYCYTYDSNKRENTERYLRYNYNVNFNSDHEKGFTNWGNCNICKGFKSSGDYNQGGTKFYPGVVMEREEDDNEGWWKYTLTGVAQPGRTVIIFANRHEPWNDATYHNYFTEDNRYPGDYEAAIPLFDYADNEGWFLFNGNTSIRDQHFTDEKPLNVIPHYFNKEMAANLKIEFLPPTSGSITKLEVKVDNNMIESNIDQNSISIKNTTIINKNAIFVDVYKDNNFYKTFELTPKNFKKDVSGYTSVVPIRLEFTPGDILFVKWSDQKINGWYNGQEREWMQYYSSSNKTVLTNLGSLKCEKAKEIGNYKMVWIEIPETIEKGCQQLALKADNNENNTTESNYSKYKYLNIEDLPKYYIPKTGEEYVTSEPNGNYYLINWNKFEPINMQ